jgi:ElaB/YqjD/DUF883 family membrane-anchored ribosome-binding protein
VNGTQDPEQLRAEIEDTRRELGETVAALSAKTDVKARARARLAELRAKPGMEHIRSNPLPTAAVAALLVGFIVGRLTARS